MTNLERIRKMPPEVLAELLVHNEPEIDCDEDIDGEWKTCAAIDRFLSPCSALEYWDYDDCVEDTIQWLNEEAVDE